MVPNDWLCKEAKFGYVGLTRLSLSNRLPLVERMLLRDPPVIGPLIDAFEEVRHTVEVASMFGLEMQHGARHFL